jgi:hypothetical protein
VDVENSDATDEASEMDPGRPTIADKSTSIPSDIDTDVAVIDSTSTVSDPLFGLRLPTSPSRGSSRVADFKRVIGSPNVDLFHSDLDAVDEVSEISEMSPGPILIGLGSDRCPIGGKPVTRLLTQVSNPPATSIPMRPSSIAQAPFPTRFLICPPAQVVGPVGDFMCAIGIPNVGGCDNLQLGSMGLVASPIRNNSVENAPSSPYPYLSGSSPIPPSPSFTRRGHTLLTEIGPLSHPNGFHVSSKTRAKLISQRQARRAARLVPGA